MTLNAIKRIGVIGAGTMGNGIAQVFAQGGFEVRLVDSAAGALDRARSTVEKSLSKLVEKGRLTADERGATLERMSSGTSLDALADVDYVVEAIYEDREAKQALFARLDQLTRTDVILSSNTSSISITVLGASTNRPDRVLGMHFMNPVPLMSLVELIRGQATSPDSMLRAAELCMRLGKTAVEASDYPGFIANRVLMPMINEAIFALMEGVGTAESIDTVMKLGMNHPMGPLTLADFIGLDVCLAIMEVLHEGLGDPKYRACPLLRRMVAAGHLGRKSGQGFYKDQWTTAGRSSSGGSPRWSAPWPSGGCGLYLNELTMLARTDRAAALELFRTRGLPALLVVVAIAVAAGATLMRQGLQMVNSPRPGEARSERSSSRPPAVVAGWMMASAGFVLAAVPLALASVVLWLIRRT